MPQFIFKIYSLLHIPTEKETDRFSVLTLNQSSLGKQDNHEEGEIKRNSFYGFLQKHDFYSTPITLSFNNKKSFQTIFGGICSIFTSILVLIYFSAKIEAFMETSYTLNTQMEFIKKTNDSQSVFNVSTDSFSIAFSLGTRDNHDMQIDRYVRPAFLSKTTT